MVEMVQRRRGPWGPPPWTGRLGVCFLLILTNEMGSESKRTEQGCNFPPDWEGIWFQSTVRPYITIHGHAMSSKGTCVESSGEKYMLKESDDCFKCVVFHQKARNVLLYKETFGCSPPSDLDSMCRYIAGDANLYSMFRVDGASVACPFRHGPMLFAYNRGKGECAWPKSEMESCTDPNKLVFHYQACPNVQGSEMMTEELECQATWKDGSFHYLVGKMSHAHASTDEDKFRCFVFEYFNPLVPSEGLHLAQSGDATCNGVFSPREGPRTLKLERGRSKANCRFARWFSSVSRWTSLDHGRSLVISPESGNASFLSLEQTSIQRTTTTGVGGEYVVRETSQVLCHQDIPKKESTAATVLSTMRVILYQTIGCKNGFVCAEFQLKTPSVLSAKMGAMSRTAEYACDNGHFAKAKSKLLVAASSSSGGSELVARGRHRTAEPGQECPLSGLFRISSVSSDEEELLLGGGGDRQQDLSVAAEVRASVKDKAAAMCADDEKEDVARRLSLVFGCGSEDKSDMEIRASCPGGNDDDTKERRRKDNFLRGYTLIHKWNESLSPEEEEDKVEEGEEGEEHQYLIFRPKIRVSSGTGDSLLCLRLLLPVRQMQQQQQRQVIVTKLDENCMESSSSSSGDVASTKMFLTFEGDCSQIGVASGGGGGGGGGGGDRFEQRAKLFIILFNLSLFGSFLGP